MSWPEGESVGALRYLERVVISSAPVNHNMLIKNPVDIVGRKWVVDEHLRIEEVRG